jgi:hypothetical protein
MAKKLNGYTSWILVALVVFGMITGSIVWAVRAEGKIEVNKTNIDHVAEDIGEIKGDIKQILEKL